MNSIWRWDSEIELSHRLAVASFIKSKHITLIFLALFIAALMFAMRVYQRCCSVEKHTEKCYWWRQRKSECDAWFSRVEILIRQRETLGSTRIMLIESIACNFNKRHVAYVVWLISSSFVTEAFSTAQSSLSHLPLATYQSTSTVRLNVSLNNGYSLVSVKHAFVWHSSDKTKPRIQKFIRLSIQPHYLRTPSAQGYPFDTANLKFDKRFAKLWDKDKF